MARYRLKGPHYLNCPGTEWEQQETPMGTAAKAVRRRHPVPRYLHPDDPSDHNYPGEIIVATVESKEHRNDIIFVGPPTPDMDPLDTEAEAVIARLKPYWEKHHPIESLSSSFSDTIQASFEAEINSKGGLQPSGPNVSLEEIEELKRSNAQLQSQVTELLALLKPKAEAARRA